MTYIDKTLKYLKENGRSSYSAICDSVFKGNERKFHEIRSYLVAEGLITVRDTDQRTLPTCYATITDRGAAKPTVEKVKTADARKRLIGHVLNTAITAFVTVVVTVLVTRWLK